MGRRGWPEVWVMMVVSVLLALPVNARLSLAIPDLAPAVEAPHGVAASIQELEAEARRLLYGSALADRPGGEPFAGAGGGYLPAVPMPRAEAAPVAGSEPVVLLLMGIAMAVVSFLYRWRTKKRCTTHS